MLTYGRAVGANNGVFSLTLIGDGSSSDLTVDLSKPPFSIEGLTPVDVVVTSGSATMKLNPNAMNELGIHVAPSPTGSPMALGQLQDVSGFLTMDGVKPTPPTVSGIEPATGGLAGGTVVTITGTGFMPGSSTVKFGAAHVATFTVDSDKQITATAPAGAAGAVDVTVTTPFGTTETGTEFTYA